MVADGNCWHCLESSTLSVSDSPLPFSGHSGQCLCEVSAAAHCLPLSPAGLSQCWCCCLQAVSVLGVKKKLSPLAPKMAAPSPNSSCSALLTDVAKFTPKQFLIAKCTFSGCYCFQSRDLPEATPSGGQREIKEN